MKTRPTVHELEEILADPDVPNPVLMPDGSIEVPEGISKTALEVAIAAAVAEERGAKDATYDERNRLVALLARLYPSGLKRTEIEGWEPEWHGCVYIDLPTGQASWHFHDSQAHLFEGLPAYQGEWDGHSTEEKYRRIAAIRARGEGGGDG